jgi:hypothetical protein
MIVATGVQGTLTDQAIAGRRVEWVSLDFEAMARGHQRVQTDAGTEVGILVARVLARSAASLHGALFDAWNPLRPSLLGKAARPLRKY